MANIENMRQLQAEIERLSELNKQQGENLKKDIHNIKEEFTPLNMIINAVSSLTGIRVERKEFMKQGFAFGFSLLFQRLLLKAERKVEHTVYNVIDSALEKLNKFISGFVEPSEKRKARMDEEGEQDV